MKRFLLTALLVLGITVMFDCKTNTGLVWQNDSRSDACILLDGDSSCIFTTAGKFLIAPRKKIVNEIKYQWRLNGPPFFLGVIAPSGAELNY